MLSLVFAAVMAIPGALFAQEKPPAQAEARSAGKPAPK
jgi:hypothetical protein